MNEEKFRKEYLLSENDLRNFKKFRKSKSFYIYTEAIEFLNKHEINKKITYEDIKNILKADKRIRAISFTYLSLYEDLVDKLNIDFIVSNNKIKNTFKNLRDNYATENRSLHSKHDLLIKNKLIPLEKELEDIREFRNYVMHNNYLLFSNEDNKNIFKNGVASLQKILISELDDGVEFLDEINNILKQINLELIEV